MPEDRDYFKMLVGKTLDEATRLPSLEDVVNKQSLELLSNYPARLVGYSSEEEIYIAEEERDGNFHIIGAPKQGKSKFLIYNMIEDIKLGNGLTLLDPTSNGSTAREVLKYCASVGYEKVCLIDHTTLYTGDKKVACIRPLEGNEVNGKIYPKKESVDGVMEAIQILFEIGKLTNTARMKRRLEALLRSLIRQGATLYEARHFARHVPLNQNPKRLHFLGDDEDSQTVEDNFRSQAAFENYFSSSINAVDLFWQEPLSLMLSANVGVDFKQMIRDKWVVLVNLCPAGNFNIYDSQLLGVLVISLLKQAADSLFRNGFRGRHYIYIDEAGRFSSNQIDVILSNLRHIGLSLIIAHQFEGQFEDKRLVQSIHNNTTTKFMFKVRDHKDRLNMMKQLGYGGEIDPEDAAHNSQNLKKQYATYSKNNAPPVQIRTPDVIETVIPTEQLDAYIRGLMNQPWCLTREQIKEQINGRYSATFKRNTGSSNARKLHDRKANSASTVSKRRFAKKAGTDTETTSKATRAGAIKFGELRDQDEKKPLD